MAVLAGCSTAQTTTFEPQDQPLGGRQGRIYFIRHPSVLTGYGTFRIKVDGKLVGELAAASYFVADRPAGTHKIAVYDVRDLGPCETDVNVEPGMSYYFEMGLRVRMNIDGFAAASMGVTGRAAPSTCSERARLMFYSLDATAGAAALAALKK